MKGATCGHSPVPCDTFRCAYLVDRELDEPVLAGHATRPMAELKTQATTSSVKDFVDAIDDEQRRAECRKLLQLMRRVTRQQPKLWGTSIVGFGKYHYKHASGREGDWFATGFSPRKQALTIYIMPGFTRYESLLKKLGKFKTGKSCLYVKSLEDVDLNTLERLVSESVKHIKQLYP